jgi:hypothetical protein
VGSEAGSVWWRPGMTAMAVCGGGRGGIAERGAGG